MSVKTTIGLLFACALAQAAIVTPVSYDTPNGNTGSYNYWDETYNGSGLTTTDGAPLTGGLGDLTDGIVAGDNWFVTEAPAGNGPYVGWTIDPTLIFRFSIPSSFTSVRIHFDDANGSGGVSTPASVTINGVNFLVTDAPGSAPFWAQFDVSSFASTDTLSIQLNRSSTWVFASEFEFQDGATGAVPEPATFAVMAAGLGALAVLRRRALR